MLSNKDAVEQSLKYVNDRRQGLIKSMETKFTRLNAALSGGLESNTITTIAAMSGAGKSTLSKELRTSIISNASFPVRCLCFNFEMLALHQIGRSVSSEASILLSKLYSLDEPLSDQDYEALKNNVYSILADKNIDFVETPASASMILNTIYSYWKKKPKEYLFVEIDHALLTLGGNEKERIDELMYGLVKLKKDISVQGGNVCYLLLCQLNRNNKDIDRIMKPVMHRPLTSDMMSSSVIEQCSDYVIVNHIPAKLGIQEYTVDKLPTVYFKKKLSSEGMEFEYPVQIPYLEVLKNRHGKSDSTIMLYNNLEYFRFDEVPLDLFKKYSLQFKEKGRISV
jgi:replicative DNA helicase